MSDGLTDANRDERECRHGRANWRECMFCVTTQERNDLREKIADLKQKAALLDAILALVKDRDSMAQFLFDAYPVGARSLLKKNWLLVADALAAEIERIAAEKGGGA